MSLIDSFTHLSLHSCAHHLFKSPKSCTLTSSSPSSHGGAHSAPHMPWVALWCWDQPLWFCLITKCSGWDNLVLSKLDQWSRELKWSGIFLSWVQVQQIGRIRHPLTTPAAPDCLGKVPKILLPWSQPTLNSAWQEKWPHWGKILIKVNHLVTL